MEMEKEKEEMKGEGRGRVGGREVEGGKREGKQGRERG